MPISAMASRRTPAGAAGSRRFRSACDVLAGRRTFDVPPIASRIADATAGPPRAFTSEVYGFLRDARTGVIESLVVSLRPAVMGTSALILVVALGACSTNEKQPGPSAAPSVSNAPATTGTTLVTSTSVTRPTPPSTENVPGGCPTGVGVAAQSAQQAARCLFQAWEADDRARAAAVASLDVVELLFQLQRTPPTATFRDCSATPVTGGQTCTFEHHGGRYLLDVRRSEGGWRVTQLQRPAS